jgi:aminoglycoside 2'-N-acetyltransferase I
MHLRVREREDFTPAELEELTRWLATAFDEPPWRREHWDDLGPGPHVVAEDDEGGLLAHACLAWVPITIGGRTLRCGYLEDVATRADVRGHGYGSAVVAATHPLIGRAAEIGFLGTGSQPFYERLGWIRWRGPSSVTEPDGAVTPTPDEDGYLMALVFAHTPPVSVDETVRRPRRDPDEPW